MSLVGLVSALVLGLSVQPASLGAARPLSWKGTPSRAPAPYALSSGELIDGAVKVATFAPQPLWLLMIALPRSQLTRAVMGPLGPVLGLALVHLAIVVTAASVEDGTAPITIFFDVFDPAQNPLDGMERLFAFRNFVAEEWPHVLIWDLFVGRAIWIDGVSRGLPIWLTAPAITLTNFIGPPGT
eukprot:scaffold297794_cov31-Tisochrysis_lutea.AAC.2